MLASFPGHMGVGYSCMWPENEAVPVLSLNWAVTKTDLSIRLPRT